MIRINLLPQEDAPRTRQIKMPEIGAFVPLGIAAAVVLVCVTTFFIQKRTYDRLQQDVAEARLETQKLAPQIARIKKLQREREQLDKRLDAITELDAERYFRVHLMSELSRRMPENCWLDRVEEVSPGQYEIEGMTFSNFVVADFLRDLDKSEYYRGLDLVKIERGKIKDFEILRFTISANVGQTAVASTSQL